MLDQRVKANQTELQIRDYEGEGEAIVFLHFSGANLMMWQRAVPYFQDLFRVILVDLRGHGKSDRPQTGYHMDDMARDLVGVIDQLGLERVHVVGSSLGAEVGLSLAANYPERVTSLVCDGALSSEFGPYSTWEGSEVDFQEHVAGELARMRTASDTYYPSLDALVERSRKSLEEIGWWNAYVEAMERYGALKVDEGKYAKAFGRQAMASYMEHYFQYRLEDYYPRVRCPLLLLPSEELLENERERAVMEGLKTLAPHGEIAAISGWEHPYGWLLRPEGACAAISRFLARTARPASW